MAVLMEIGFSQTGFQVSFKTRKGGGLISVVGGGGGLIYKRMYFFSLQEDGL